MAALGPQLPALPPVDAFWSITLYRASDYFLVPNPIDRYSIGDRTRGLRYGKDGSLEITLSATRPRQGISNWLPIPAGAFHVVTRLYLPAAEAMVWTIAAACSLSPSELMKLRSILMRSNGRAWSWLSEA